MKNIVLIGMPATGKSTVGVILAKLLGYNFLDADILIALQQNRTLTQIISEDGYDKFIEIEGNVGKSIECEKTVIATGGSMVFSKEAMDNLSKNGVVVWLDTPVSELEKRIMGTLLDRGVATPYDMSFREIYEMRLPLYEKYANIHFPCSGEIEKTVLDLKKILLEGNFLI